MTSGLARSKVLSIEDAIRLHIRPGDAIHLSFGDARPNFAIREIVKQFRGTEPRFTVMGSGLLSAQQALLGAGLVARLMTSFAGENYPVPRPSPVVRRALESGRLEIEEWSILALSLGLLGGALGLPFVPTRSFAGDSAPGPSREIEYEADDEPGVRGRVRVVPALHPDVVLLHAVAGDAQGNIVLGGPRGESAWAALAAQRGAVVTVERLLEPNELRSMNAVVEVPAFAVLSVSEAPGGSHPYGCFVPSSFGFSGYDEDRPFIDAAREAMRGEESFQNWIDQWLAMDAPTSVSTGGRAVEGAKKSHCRTTAGVPSDAEYTDSELLVVGAAREIRRRIPERGAKLLLAGIGLGNLAAWLAYEQFDSEDRPELIAEIGMLGYEPLPGDPYIFANQNKVGARQLTDVVQMLGSYVGHETARTLAVLGAGQVDAQGNINSTFAVDGRYLTGSGGANDIASAADEVLVVIKASVDRTPATVPFVTAPGSSVRRVVTSRGIFGRRERNERFVLERVLVPWGEHAEADDVLVERALEEVGWGETATAFPVQREDPPTAEELAALRAFDPERLFIL